MSDFLSRLGARHLAEPAIRPRVVSRFEMPATPLAAPSSGVEGASLARAAHDGQRDTTTDALAGGERVVRPPKAWRDVDTASGARGHSPDSPSPETERAAHVHAREDRNALEATTATRSLPPVEVESRRDAAAVIPRITTTIAPRIAQPITGVSRTEGLSTDSDARAAVEPNVIRVHIGRVEVRAVLPAPERSRPRAPNPSDATRPMSLDRYLAGKDRA